MADPVIVLITCHDLGRRPAPVAELYDLRADALERHNVLDGDARPAPFEELRTALLARMGAATTRCCTPTARSSHRSTAGRCTSSAPEPGGQCLGFAGPRTAEAGKLHRSGWRGHHGSQAPRAALSRPSEFVLAPRIRAPAPRGDHAFGPCPGWRS
jgi:hypothetical protein